MNPAEPSAPSQSEGDVNLSPRRSLWQREHLDDATRALLARDASAIHRMPLVA